MPPLVLIVDPDELFLARLRSVARSIGYEAVCETEFASARQCLVASKPAVVVANIRLKAFNGIHLAYLAKAGDLDTSVILYDSGYDLVLAREAQRAHAFYERQQGIPLSLRNYLAARLPSRDRRSPQTLDRRTAFRGGRRATDVEGLHAAPAAQT